MPRSFLRQLTQICSSVTYDDAIVPSEANYETSPAEIEADLNSLRSRANDLLNRDDTTFTGNWYDAISAPSTFENGIARGVDKLNQELHDLERKRFLDRVAILGNDITIGTAGDQHVILGTGELPGNTTMAVGVTTLLGTVAAFEASFDTATLTEVTGANALRPKNLVVIWNSTGANIGDPIEDGSGLQIFGLLQTENAADGHTATDTTPNRLQMSFVKINAGGDDLELITSGEMDGVTFDYAPVQRFALEDIPEEALLGTNFIDSGVANTTRQAGYDNQGVVPVDVTTNSFLDLESAGLTWEIRDDLEQMLIRVTEGSATSDSAFTIGADVDDYVNNALSNTFNTGVTVNAAGSRTILVGEADGEIGTDAGDLMLRPTAELLFDDGNQTGSTWVQDGIKLSETTAEWNTFRTNFGESSVISAINQAAGGALRTKVQSTMTSNVTAGNDVNGPSFANNCGTDLAPFNLVTFNTDVDVLLNGNMLRHTDDVIAGTSSANGDLEFTFDLVGTGSKPDQLHVIVNGQ